MVIKIEMTEEKKRIQIDNDDVCDCIDDKPAFKFVPNPKPKSNLESKKLDKSHMVLGSVKKEHDLDAYCNKTALDSLINNKSNLSIMDRTDTKINKTLICEDSDVSNSTRSSFNSIKN